MVSIFPRNGVWAIEDKVFRNIIVGFADSRREIVMRGGLEQLRTDIEAANANGGTPPKVSEGGVLVIPIRGVMEKEISLIGWLYGGTSTIAIKTIVDAAAADESVKAIILLIDSPGGSVEALAELGDSVYAAQQVKRVIAYVEDMAASAAYYVASQASTIYAGRMSMVGSIGSRLVMYDFSKAFEAEGVTPIIIDTGEFKSTGVMGKEVSDAEQADLQRIVDGFFADFIDAIVRGRTKLDRKDILSVADGRMFFAKDAKRIGLIDGVQTWEETVNKVMGTAGGGRNKRARNERVLQLAKEMYRC